MPWESVGGGFFWAEYHETPKVPGWFKGVTILLLRYLLFCCIYSIFVVLRYDLIYIYVYVIQVF